MLETLFRKSPLSTHFIRELGPDVIKLLQTSKESSVVVKAAILLEVLLELAPDDKSALCLYRYSLHSLCRARDDEFSATVVCVVAQRQSQHCTQPRTATADAHWAKVPRPFPHRNGLFATAQNKIRKCY